MNPLVSILIPVYNREKIISETISCAINQTYKNIEIIISDNCSTDNTWGILKEWVLKDTRIKIFKNEKNLGPVLNWKNCLDKANGIYAKILWSDDLISKSFIENTLELFDNDTAFVLTSFAIFQSDSKNIINKFTYKNIYSTSQFIYNSIIYNSERFPVSPGCALFRTNDLKESLIIDIPNKEKLEFKKFGAGNDLLLFLITAKKYKNIKIYPKIESYFRVHSNSITIENNQNLLIYYEWSRKYFVEIYYKKLKNRYKTVLFLKKHTEGYLYNNIYKHTKGTINIFSLIHLISIKIYYKTISMINRH